MNASCQQLDEHSCNKKAVLSRGEPRNAAVNFDVYCFTTASCGYSATARLSCIHQWPFKCRNYTHYADFYGRGANHGGSRKSRHTTKFTIKAMVVWEIPSLFGHVTAWSGVRTGRANYSSVKAFPHWRL